MLALIGSSVLVAEQWSGAVPLLVLFLLVQASLYGAMLWLVARLSLRIVPSRWLVILLLTFVIFASAVPVYRDPYQRDSPRATILQVYR